MVESFDRVFQVIDENTKELRAEFKSDISDLRKEMNQRFLVVDDRFVSIDKRFIAIDRRLLSIENNMVCRPEFTALTKRVKLLEA
jgi:hypothetical protein